MQITEQTFKILMTPDEATQTLKKIEQCGRICYQSQDKITDESYKTFISNIIKRGHEAVIEAGSVTVIFKTTRSVTHELVRHRIASYAQESQRYVKYNDIEYILPECELNTYQHCILHGMLRETEDAYRKLIESGLKPEIARAILPNATKTQIAITANFREWRTIFKLRCSQYAHPDIRTLMINTLREMKRIIPVIFDDFIINEEKNIACSNLS